jgi:hypothetical protein
MSWHEEALRLYKPGEFGPAKIGKQLGVKTETVKTFLRKAKLRGEVQTGQTNKEKITYNQDGLVVSEKFIKLQEGKKLTPKEILVLHGFEPEKWEIVSCTNNFWNSQLKGGIKQISYQSKLTVKPIKQAISFEDIKHFYETLDRKYRTPPVICVARNTSMMAEVNIADLHLGKLCWHGDTGANYDHKIARDMFFNIISRVCGEIKNKPLEYITFIWTNDFFNSDTIEKTTTAGTQQDTDVIWKKLYCVGCEMLISAIDMLATETKVPVKTFYTPSNHDEVTAYHAILNLKSWFRHDMNITVDTDATPRKYQLYGNTLIGYSHGEKESSKGTHEKASRLASLMPLEANDLWSKSKFREFHTAHLHSEQMIQEINGVIVRRVSSPTAADTYHTTHGFIGAVRKAQTFLYDKEQGLTQIINTPVKEG